MRIKFANYAFKDILKLLHDSNIDDIVITKEDSQLILYLDDKQLYNNENCVAASGWITKNG